MFGLRVANLGACPGTSPALHSGQGIFQPAPMILSRQSGVCFQPLMPVPKRLRLAYTGIVYHTSILVNWYDTGIFRFSGICGIVAKKMYTATKVYF
jgi:hypothetical protein